MAVTKQTLLDSRVAGGANRDDSEHLLNELLVAHDGDNLVSALVHQGFATQAQAEAYVAAGKPVW